MTGIIEYDLNDVITPPSLFCTVVHLSSGCGTVRLTFGEKLNDTCRFRAAVSLPVSEARKLAEAITALIAEPGPKAH